MSQAYVFRNVQLDGLTLRAAVRPGKPGSTPLLICNGIGANLEILSGFVDALPADIEVLLFDAPGVGGSSTAMLPMRFSGLAKLLTRLLDALNYAQVNVLGVSWGGGLAQQFAHDYPERCKKLILAATTAGAAMLPGKPHVLLLMASPRRYHDEEHTLKIVADIYGGSFRRNPELAKEMLKISQAKTADKRGYYWQLSAAMGWTSIHWLHRLPQPTLVLAGDDDPLIPLINMRLLAWRIPKAQLHVIDDGHLFLITRVETVAPLVADFLREKPGKTVIHPRPA